MKYRRSILENSAKRFSLTEALYLNAESRGLRTHGLYPTS